MDIPLPHLTALPGLLVAACFLCFLLSSLLYLYYYGRPLYKSWKKVPLPDPWPEVSIILCVQNEYDNLTALLPALLTQQYPAKYEVIVVDLDSEDDTEILISSLAFKYPHLVHRKVATDSRFGLSHGIQTGVGIKAAQYETLVFFTPECMPCDPHWLRCLVQPYGRPGTANVLAYTRYKNANPWVRADMMLHQLHALGAAMHGHPYGGVDNNFAIRRQLFFDVNGFDSRLCWQHSPNRVLIGQTARRRNTAGSLHPGSSVDSSLTFNADQWRRYRQTELNSIALTSKVPFSPMLPEQLLRMAFYLLLPIAILSIPFTSYHLIPLGIVIGLPVLRWLMVYLLYWRARHRYREKRLGLCLLIWDLTAPLVHLYWVYYRLLQKNK